jgi:hypothetical protein
MHTVTNEKVGALVTVTIITHSHSCLHMHDMCDSMHDRFGVEINDTALRFYVDDAENNTIFTVVAPPLCVTDDTFDAQGGWGKSTYMPWHPLYGILNVAMNKGDKTEWWSHNNATTEVDWGEALDFRT